MPQFFQETYITNRTNFFSDQFNRWGPLPCQIGLKNWYLPHSCIILLSFRYFFNLNFSLPSRDHLKLVLWEPMSTDFMLENPRKFVIKKNECPFKHIYHCSSIISMNNIKSLKSPTNIGNKGQYCHTPSTRRSLRSCPGPAELKVLSRSWRSLRSCPGPVQF